MGNAFFVVWRESLEAFLIAGILYAWLAGSRAPERGRRALFLGLAAGVGLALVLGSALIFVQDELTGEALELFQIGTLVVAAGLMTQMVLWMRKHGRQMKAQLHAELTAASQRSGLLGIATVAALAVAREGAEIVIFLYGIAQEATLDGLITGALAGFLAAALTAWIAARGLARLKLAPLLSISSLLLLVFASALLVAACDRLIGIGWLPAGIDPLWDSSWLLDDGTIAGKLIADFSGYRAHPALTSLVLYAAYWLSIARAYRAPRAPLAPR